MKPKFICDNCEELLKVLEEDGECFYSIDNHIVGMSQMKHNNTKNKIILCESCFDEFKQNLIEEEDWSELQYLEDGMKDFYYFDKLKEHIIEENEKKM